MLGTILFIFTRDAVADLKAMLILATVSLVLLAIYDLSMMRR